MTSCNPSGPSGSPYEAADQAGMGETVSRYQAVFNGQVIADSDDVVLLEGNVYFPLAAVRGDVLRRSRAKSLCFWKGIASYYTVEVGGARTRAAAWTYRHPSPLARSIKDRVAFWGGVQVSAVDELSR